VVVGCGDWQAIRHYKEVTSFPYGINADPTRKLYHALGLTIENLAGTPAGQERRSYLRKGDVANALASTWRALKNPSLMGKQGNISQLGGEFVFKSNECSFASRMQHTQDHTEVDDLMRTAGVTVYAVEHNSSLADTS
ncbi:AhpC/TSA antioxidant enzyme-domain-containing protein, partial [Hygrophoropsis aurantiaca]